MLIIYVYFKWTKLNDFKINDSLWNTVADIDKCGGWKGIYKETEKVAQCNEYWSQNLLFWC